MSKSKQQSSREPRRILDPFDVMRATHALAPHDPKLNDLRWLTGEALRRVWQRSQIDGLQSVPTTRVTGGSLAPGSGLLTSEIALHARGKLRVCEDKVGPDCWPVLVEVIVRGRRLAECRSLVPEVVTAWRCDAVLMDRIRRSLDSLFSPLGIS